MHRLVVTHRVYQLDVVPGEEQLVEVVHVETLRVAGCARSVPQAWQDGPALLYPAGTPQGPG